MSTAEQRAAAHLVISGLITQAARGDASAERYLRTIAGAARVLDDLVDGDHPVDHDALLATFAGLLVGLQGNAFYRKHIDYLTACHQLALNAWLDANEWEKHPDALRRLYAHVWRDAINALLPAVAYLTGGWTHMRDVSRSTREAFLKETK